MPIGYRNLDVWQKSMQLIKNIYALTRNLPDVEKFGLVSQMQRAVVSIAANIAEGHGRETNKEYAKFLRYSKGSLYELETELAACVELNYVTSVEAKIAFGLMDEISRMLNSFIKKLDKQ